MNRATLLGNLGRDPEIRTTANGTKVATLSIATNESWRDKSTGEKKERVEWHRVVVWGDGLIDNVVEKYLKKGSKVLIEGTIRTRDYEDKDGVKRYTTEIHLSGFNSTLTLLGDASGRPPPPDSNPADNAAAAPASPEARRAQMDDEIPF